MLLVESPPPEALGGVLPSALHLNNDNTRIMYVKDTTDTVVVNGFGIFYKRFYIQMREVIAGERDRS